MAAAVRRDVGYYLAGQFYQLATYRWGQADLPVVLCVHGLSRNALDFEVLAERLANRFHVVSVDLPGRGGSAWLAEPGLYQPLSYVQALSHVLAEIGRPVDWVGTSLGGICGMLAVAAGAPVRRMVLNDIGPFVPRAALQRIKEYIGGVKRFADLDAASAYFSDVHAPFGKLSAAQWRRFAEISTRPTPEGDLRVHYDPAMTLPIVQGEPADMDLGPFWARIAVPMLALRGAESDLLLPETFAAMGAKAQLHTVPDCGHAPALQDDATIAVIEAFLAD